MIPELKGRNGEKRKPKKWMLLIRHKYTDSIRSTDNAVARLKVSVR